MFEIGLTDVDRDLLLLYNSEETYMSFYLGIPITKGLFCSPLRNDHRPTCSFFRHKDNKRLMYKDFGDGFYGDFISVVMHKYQIDYNQAIKRIANDFDIINDPTISKSDLKLIHNNEIIAEKAPAILQITVGQFSEQDLNWWGEFGITLKTLNKFRVYRADYVFLNGVVCSYYKNTDPSYGYYFGIQDNRQLWKIYYPFRKKNRFLLNTSEIQGTQQLPERGDVLVITKSLKDVMSLYELGIPAIAPQAESIILSQELVDHLRERFTYLVFNGDWDPAGKRFMIKNRKLHGGICLSFKNKDVYGKDISDFIRNFGMDSARQLIKDIISKCKLI